MSHRHSSTDIMFRNAEAQIKAAEKAEMKQKILEKKMSQAIKLQEEGIMLKKARLAEHEKRRAAVQANYKTIQRNERSERLKEIRRQRNQMKA